jgi:GH24 family phage-related lysozyme (muramidase)
MPLKSKLVSRAAGALFGMIAVVVGVNEGRSLVSYQDPVGVWTICDGETLGVKPGERRTEAQCDATLRKGIARHAEALSGLPEGLPDAVLVGAVDLTYNIGTYGFRSSRVYKALAVGDYKAAGAAVLAWRYVSQTKAPAPALGWTYNNNTKRWQFDCSQSFNGKRNTVCWGLWERRQWQAKAIGNQFKSAQEAVAALPK